MFSIQKYEFFRKVKANKGLRGGVRDVRLRATPQFDAEIAKKGHLWMETI